jgi:hypothetical protein
VLHLSEQKQKSVLTMAALFGWNEAVADVNHRVYLDSEGNKLTAQAVDVDV